MANPAPRTVAWFRALTGFIEKTLVITEFELRKLRHDFTELITRALQPALWLLIFGQVFARSGAVHTGNIPYMDFIAPGILAQSILFVAIFYGINVIWERDLGIVQKFLASPTPRAALVLGKGFSAGVRTLSQAIIVYGLSLLVGVKLNWSPIALLNILIIVILAATLFGTFSLIIACIVKTRERFMGVGQVLTMPLFFASNAIYPTNIMPSWLKTISYLNPLTYVVDALRTFMLTNSPSTFGLGRDYTVILLTTLILVFIGARLYPRLAS
jgi:ABC-2 type transport system permease protein